MNRPNIATLLEKKEQRTYTLQELASEIADSLFSASHASEWRFKINVNTADNGQAITGLNIPLAIAMHDNMRRHGWFSEVPGERDDITKIRDFSRSLLPHHLTYRIEPNLEPNTPECILYVSLLGSQDKGK